jgi:hypothetical protein
VQAATRANPRANAEGNIGAGGHFRFAFRQETIWIKQMRIAPIGLVPMQHPRCHHDQRALLHRVVSDARCLIGDTRQEGDGWIKPQRFSKHVAHKQKLARMFEQDGAWADNLIHLSAQPRDKCWLRREQIENPGQRAGAGFMPGQEQHAELINQFFAREGFAFHIMRGDDGARDIVKAAGAIA